MYENMENVFITDDDAEIFESGTSADEVSLKHTFSFFAFLLASELRTINAS